MYHQPLPYSAWSRLRLPSTVQTSEFRTLSTTVRNSLRQMFLMISIVLLVVSEIISKNANVVSPGASQFSGAFADGL
jgi:hypothetical protein